ncbi:uncharacterized protein BDZ99DRAFT_575098 [Mytilinidion resinicola]|uniref:Uncharacterized protein n=1 Tax=Mytilinidion resinicola TaxID=574789 RepID=A0A6A6YAP2_9PEZI|nr:uncharacterized protein BDZ99DRAFT_575098 [Mytilinidion resinicola]KAF2804907.1 hypothetical protein BDZ99DRAFT_575098 [Mytilinidion resinicola]
MHRTTLLRIVCLLALCLTSKGAPLDTPNSFEIDDRAVINIYINDHDETAGSPAACGLLASIPAGPIPTTPTQYIAEPIPTSPVSYTAEPISPLTAVELLSSPTASPQAPQETNVLRPAVHWDVDLNDHEHLTACMSIDLFYLESRSKDNALPHEEPTDVAIGFVSVPEMNYPSVQLEHTNFVSSMTCSGDTATIILNDLKAFNIAVSDWSKQTAGLVLISTSPSCGSGQPQEAPRHYLLVSNLDHDDHAMAITGKIKHLDFTEAVAHDTPIDVKFGNFSLSGKEPINTYNMSAPGGNSTEGYLVPLTGNSSNHLIHDDSFDSRLDDGIGRINLNNLSDLNKTLPGATNFTLLGLSGNSNTTDLLRRSGLEKRFHWPKIITSVGHAIGSVVGGAVSAVGHAIGDVVQAAGSVLDHLTTISKDLSGTFSMDTLSKGNTVATPWGPRGYSLYEASSGAGHLGVYCVRCGASGQLALNGHFVFSVAHGFEEGTVAVKGTLQGTLQLGVDASYSTTVPLYEKRIVDMPLTWLTIPGIISVGPEFYVDATSSLTLQASGQVLAGGVLNWPAIDAVVDVINRENSKLSTLGIPALQPVLDVKGSVKAAADASLKVALAFGIDILKGTWKKQAALIDKPSFSIAAGVSGSASITNGGVSYQIGDAACPGISLDVSFKNELSAEENIIGNKVFPITTFQKDLWKKCFPLGTPPIPAPAVPPSSVPAPLVNPFPKPKIPISLGGKYHQVVPRAETPPAAPTANTTDITPNSQLVQITTPEKNVTVVAADNGNMYAVHFSVVSSYPALTSSSYFAKDDAGNLIYSDSTGRVIFGYADTVRSMGVSRLRLGSVDAVPKTAALVSFVPAPLSNTTTGAPRYLTVVDTFGNIYVPVACLYNNTQDGMTSAKLFLSNDTVSGPRRLESGDSEVTDQVTGGGDLLSEPDVDNLRLDLQIACPFTEWGL